MAKKRRITNEEIGKVLFDALSKHSENMSKHESRMNEVIVIIEHLISEAKQVNFKPDLTPIQTILKQFTEQTEKSVNAVQKTLKTPNYLLYSLLGMIVVVIISVVLSVYVLNTLSQNAENQTKITEYEEMRTYFQTFLNESEDGKEAFEIWKSEKGNH
ncbi:MAG: hypothetical protein ACR2MS_03215 [Weeksellaceae bacterium]